MSQQLETEPKTSTPEIPLESSDNLQNEYQKQEYSAWVMFFLLIIGLVIAYRDGFLIALEAWSMEMYSHGWIIPLLALILLWLRKEPFQPFPSEQRWYGLILLFGSLVARVICDYYAWETPMLWTFVPSVAFCFLIVGGWPMFRWAGPVCFLLFFMFPLPWQFEDNLLAPLQQCASASSEFLLQLLGFVTIREGNQINVSGIPLNVVGACSGLRMTTIFLALSIALVLIAQRVWWENLIILICAIPIALIVNIMRITVTGIGYSFFGVGGTAEKLIHDWSGLAMVPMSLILLWCVLRILSLLFYEDNTEDIVSLYDQNLGGADRGVKD